MIPALNRLTSRLAGTTRVRDRSYRVFRTPRRVPITEMEYAIPRDARPRRRPCRPRRRRVGTVRRPGADRGPVRGRRRRPAQPRRRAATCCWIAVHQFARARLASATSGAVEEILPASAAARTGASGTSGPRPTCADSYPGWDRVRGGPPTARPRRRLHQRLRRARPRAGRVNDAAAPRALPGAAGDPPPPAADRPSARPRSARLDEPRRAGGRARAAGSRTTAPTGPAAGAATRSASSSGCSPTSAAPRPPDDPHRRRDRARTGAWRRRSTAASRGSRVALALIDQPVDEHVRAQLERLAGSGATIHRTHTKARTIAARALADAAPPRRPPAALLPARRRVLAARCRRLRRGRARDRRPGRGRRDCPSPRTSSPRSAPAGRRRGWRSGCGSPGSATQVDRESSSTTRCRLDSAALREARGADREAARRSRRGGEPAGADDLRLESVAEWLGAGYGHPTAESERARRARRRREASGSIPSTRRRRWRRPGAERARAGFGDGPVLFLQTDGPRRRRPSA